MTRLFSDATAQRPWWRNLLESGPAELTGKDAGLIALFLRLGIGAVFLVGGWWKLSRALDPARADALVARYTAPNGYINAFFQDYLFSGGWISPWMFLTALSALELVAGIALILGLLVRPFAILFGLLVWSFVAALPVLTAPGLGVEDGTFLTPSLIVQIRDIGLSGMCFVLVAAGSGKWSLDASVINRGAHPLPLNWSVFGLLLRLSVAVVFIAGGAFFGLDHVKSWSSLPILLIVIGVVMASGHGVRLAAGAALAVVLVYCLNAINVDKALWDNFNAVKREIAFIAAAAVLLRFSGGPAFRVGKLFEEPRDVLFGPSQTHTQA